MAYKPIRWAIQPGLENFAGLAMYLRDQEENLKQAFSQPSRSVRKILPGYIVIDYVMNDVVDFIQISMLRKPPKGKNIPMIWHKEPPYKVDENGNLVRDDEGKLTWVLDFESEDMIEDPDVEGGYYFLVSVVNGRNEKQEILLATFVIKKGKDLNGDDYPDWSIKQGKRIIEGETTSYKVDGKYATILLGDDVEGEATIIANDGETVLTRKIAIPNDWQILYVPDPGAPTAKYIIARKTDLEPLKKYYLTSEADYWGPMPVDANLFDNGTSTASYSGEATPVGEAVDAGGGWWYKDYTGEGSGISTVSHVFSVKSSNLAGATVYWGPVATSAVDHYSHTGTCRKWWQTGQSEPADPVFEPPFNGWSNVVKTEGAFRAEQYYAIGKYALEDSWLDDASHNGFFIGHFISEGTASVYTTTFTEYFVYDGVMHEVASYAQTYDHGTLSAINGTQVQPIKVSCYKKEDLVDEDGEQPSDVAVASYSIGTGGRYPEGNLANRTSIGYIAIIDGEAIIKTFPILGASRYDPGYHELVEKAETQLYSKGWFEVHKRKGVAS